MAHWTVNKYRPTQGRKRAEGALDVQDFARVPAFVSDQLRGTGPIYYAGNERDFGRSHECVLREVVKQEKPRMRLAGGREAGEAFRAKLL